MHYSGECGRVHILTAGNATTFKGVMHTCNTATLTNGYTSDSLRAWKQNASGKTYFLYAGSRPVCELSSAGAVTATNTFGSTGLISRRTSSGSVFYAFDYKNSAVQRLDSGGNVLSTQTFDAYGTRQSTDGNSDPYAGFGGGRAGLQGDMR